MYFKFNIFISENSLEIFWISKGAVHKPRGQFWGKGGARQKSTIFREGGKRGSR